MIERYTRKEMGRIFSEENKFEKYLEIEMLVCEAWSKLGRIKKSDLLKIERLADFNVKQIQKIEERTNHDVIAFLESVAYYVGDLSKYIHIGMTSSDIIDTATSLILIDALRIIEKNLKELNKVLKEKALKYKDAVCIGRTHGVHAEPMTMGLRFANWYSINNRNIERLSRCKEIISVGKISGPVGTYSNIDPFIERYVCKKLGLRPAQISTQILQRDRHAELLNEIAVIAATIELIAINIRLMQITEISEAEEPFGKKQKGSSAMPHKRNPVICERICGLARTIKGYANVELSNVALWFERDISHSSSERIILQDALILLDYIIYKTTAVVKDIVIFTDNLKLNLEKSRGRIFTQAVLLALTDKGFPREKAYEIVQKIAFKSMKKQLDFNEVLKNDPVIKKYLTDSEIDSLTDIKKFLKNIDIIYRRLGIK
ncbi:MAG: adenylosuccinate lyase [Candidatus Hydrogenedentota bacterium]